MERTNFDKIVFDSVPPLVLETCAIHCPPHLGRQRDALGPLYQNVALRGFPKLCASVYPEAHTWQMTTRPTPPSSSME